ncbi:MAG: hypothetical protein JRI59_09895 [Deltaproteobacteria bacterium]|nr:hypothetical protein [Deltaproteobacteria bacterium]
MPEKLKRLSALVLHLARLSHLEAAALLEALKERLKLRAADLAELKADLRAARKKREGKDKAPALAVADLAEIRRLHPAVDFPDGHMTLGFRVDLPDGGEGLLLIISDGQGVQAMVNPEAVDIGGRTWAVGRGTPPWLQDRWALDRLRAFLERPTSPANLYDRLKAALQAYLDLPDPAYGLLAAWTAGTYFTQLFVAYPFLHLFGPKETGKSKTLEALACLCFNPFKGRDITAAALGDTVDGQRGTLLFDQAEKLSSENGNIIGLLADSYKKAGGKRRVVEVSKSGRSVLEFSTYGPKAFASTKPLNQDPDDRCIRVPMTRTRRRLPDLEGFEPVWAELRDALYRFSLAAFKEVAQAYQAIPGDGTRLTELWRPIGALLQALGVDPAEAEAVRKFYMRGAMQTRHEPSDWEAALLETLQEQAEKADGPFEMTAGEILEAMGIEGDVRPGKKWLGEALARFNLFKEKLPRRYLEGNRRRKVQPYLFDPSQVLRMCEIYLRDTPQNDPSHASQTENLNDTSQFHGTEPNSGTRPGPSQTSAFHGDIPDWEREDLQMIDSEGWEEAAPEVFEL